MSAEPSTAAIRPSLRHRADAPGAGTGLRGLAGPAIFVAAAAGFVLIGGGNLDLGPSEAKLGLSAVEPIGPFGQSLGGWEPGVWVGSVLPSRLWAVVSGMKDSAIVRWPAAIAGIVLGYILCRAMRLGLCRRASALTALCWFGGLALMDRSADAGLDMIAGLGTIAALNRLLTKGSGWLAGLFAAWAFLAGGWPPLAMIALASILLGRAGATLSIRMALPVLAAVVGWSAWALATLVLVAVSLKLAHWGHHVPEWNYRHSQVPWGHAIGQWVPAGVTVHVLVGWPPDLVFAIEHPVRSLADPRLLPDLPGPSPKFILLTGTEYANWQPHWPKVVPVVELLDEQGDGRVLARTEGPFSWRKAALEARAAE